MSAGARVENAACWPAVSWSVESRVVGAVHGGMSSIPARVFRVDLPAEGLAALMESLDWGTMGEGEGVAAVECLAEMLGVAQEFCADSAGHDFRGSDLAEPIKAALSGASADWERCLEGRQAWPKDARIAISSVARTDLNGMPAKNAIKKARGLAGAMMDLLERLGAKPELGQTSGFQGLALSALRAGPGAMDDGGVFCIDIGEGDLACANIAPERARALEATILGAALPPWHLFRALRSAKPIKRVLGLGLSGGAFGSRALAMGGGGPGSDDRLFPCAIARGVRFGKAPDRSDFEAARDALVAVLGPVEVDAVARSQTDGTSRFPSNLQRWMRELPARDKARVEADAIEAAAHGALADAPPPKIGRL